MVFREEIKILIKIFKKANQNFIFSNNGKFHIVQNVFFFFNLET